MAKIVLELYRGYHKIMDEYSDPRTKDWFLVSNPMILATIIAVYLYFSIKSGPRFMTDRKPFELKRTLIVYNIFQIFLSAYIVYEGGRAAWLGEYNYFCQPIDYSNDPKAAAVTAVVWWYYFAKITELFDTVFFVLRKKVNQVTTLHVYHHAIMPFISWICVRFFAGGHGTLVGWINAMIHVVMYTYYLISGLGPQYKKYVWWKKHLTALQLIQFCLLFLHNFSVLFRDCNYPKILNVMIIAESCIFIYLFGSFYYSSYVKNTKRKTAKIDLSNKSI